MKITLGLVLGLLIGAGCRLADIPVPAPQALMGALLVLAMTVGSINLPRIGKLAIVNFVGGRPVRRSARIV